MPDKNNKVKFNLKNAHYALLTIAEDGAVSYAAPTPMPGSVSISLDANGEPENFYADGVAYYVINNNMGYDGDLELAMIPESFRTDVLKEKLDAKGVLIENSEVELASFALLFEFDGDQKHIRHKRFLYGSLQPFAFRLLMTLAISQTTLISLSVETPPSYPGGPLPVPYPA